jgi:hypothetical protein
MRAGRHVTKAADVTIVTDCGPDVHMRVRSKTDVVRDDYMGGDEYPLIDLRATSNHRRRMDELRSSRPDSARSAGDLTLGSRGADADEALRDAPPTACEPLNAAEHWESSNVRAMSLRIIIQETKHSKAPTLRIDRLNDVQNLTGVTARPRDDEVLGHVT